MEGAVSVRPPGARNRPMVSRPGGNRHPPMCSSMSTMDGGESASYASVVLVDTPKNAATFAAQSGLPPLYFNPTCSSIIVNG